MTTKHPAIALWEQHHPPAGYPADVACVHTPIPGRAFFPGGYGLYSAVKDKPLPSFPVGEVMVLGHNFHSESGYKSSFALGSEPDSNPTWRGILKTLSEAGISPDTCFFTNFFMGLIPGDKATGKFLGARNPHFTEHCLNFFVKQLDEQRPRLVLVLGLEYFHLLAQVSDDMKVWRKGMGLADIDAAGPVISGAAIREIPGFKTNFVLLVHPSYCVNQRHRRYDGLCREAAETRMICDGLMRSTATYPTSGPSVAPPQARAATATPTTPMPASTCHKYQPPPTPAT